MNDLFEDEEVVSLLANVFHNEFRQGLTIAQDSEQDTAPASSIERADTSSRRRCNFEGCNNVLVSKGRCIRHGGGGRCIVEGCATSSKRDGLCWKHGSLPALT
ncbi:hypothetical protein AC1031_009928 [Aphanomyces cochlioides]|nr:hypothetical protein AC1031_009928 [Aphanomyces cochlioides]